MHGVAGDRGHKWPSPTRSMTIDLTKNLKERNGLEMVLTHIHSFWVIGDAQHGDGEHTTRPGRAITLVL